jgi:AraC-like DNA-binding protein
LEPDKDKVLTIDEQFINKARKVVESNLSDYEFTVERFADELALSRFHLNRKLQNLTGFTPSRFIREIRLKKAVHFLKNKKDNISQIALEVGFDNFAYFNRCFKERYGCPPSKYVKN